MELGSLLALRPMLRVFFFIFALLNIKNLPLVWHYRIFRTFFARANLKPRRAVDPNCLFLPVVATSRSPLLETDFNMHKSNSTYLTDADNARCNCALYLLGDSVAITPWSKKPRIMLGGTQCAFRKEIKSYKAYEMWTRLVAWDDKWFYAITHFVEKGRFKPVYYLQTGNEEDFEKVPQLSATEKAEQAELNKKAIYASVVTRSVFKQGWKTVKPEDIFRQAGLLPDDEKEMMKVDETRKRNLEIFEGAGNSFEKVHGAFFDETGLALARYTDLLCRA